MTEGTIVNLVDVSDSVIRRIVVAVENGVLFVCKEEEYRLAQLEQREPLAIGFRAEYLVGIEGA